MTLRRMKTYTGGQGYVYQYYFVGKRAALASEPSAPAEEFIFDVTSDRKTTFSVSVLLPAESLKQWSSVHGRALNEAEQYGAVKMRLFQAFERLEFVPVALIYFVLTYADRQVLLRFGTLADVGVYSLAIKMAAPMLVAITATRFLRGKTQ